MIFWVNLRTSYRAHVWHPSTLQYPVGIFLWHISFWNIPKHAYSTHGSTFKAYYLHTFSFLQFQQACLGTDYQVVSLLTRFIWFSPVLLHVFPPLLFTPPNLSPFLHCSQAKGWKIHISLLQLQYSSMYLTSKFLNSADLVLDIYFFNSYTSFTILEYFFSGSAPCWDCI